MSLANRETGEIMEVLADACDVADILADNLAGEDIGPGDLERIKLPVGGMTKWLRKDGSTYDFVEGVIIHHRIDRTWWEHSIEETGGGAPPDCYSHDLRIKPNRGSLPEPAPELRENRAGGECDKCPMNAYGSGKDGVGKACKQTHLLFIIRPGEALPAILSATPGSLPAIKHYFVGLASRRLKPQYAYHRLALEQATSTNGFTYARILPLEALALTPEGRIQADDVSELLAGLLKSVEVDRSDVDGTTGEWGAAAKITPGSMFHGHHVEEAMTISPDEIGSVFEGPGREGN